jgi:uncharacterized BrkB/YihY/UPF0761 family membrane protein
MGWMIVTLVPFGALAGLLTFHAVRNWVDRIQGEDPVPDLGDTVWLTVVAALMLILLVLWVVVGAARFREQRSAADGRPPSPIT